MDKEVFLINTKTPIALLEKERILIELKSASTPILIKNLKKLKRKALYS